MLCYGAVEIVVFIIIIIVALVLYSVATEAELLDNDTAKILFL